MTLGSDTDFNNISDELSPGIEIREQRIMHILLVEDDIDTANFAVNGLVHAGHIVDVINNGKEVMIRCLKNTYDVLVINRILPGMDGLTVLKALRASGIRTPALFLSAACDFENRDEGFKAGCDDCMTKPYSFSELSARVDALAQKQKFNGDCAPSSYRVADLRMNLISRSVTRGDTVIELGSRELLLLEVLMHNGGKVVSRSMLLEQVWQFYFDPKTSVVETHINRLRDKVDKPFNVSLIHTVPNIGYSLRAPHM